MKELSDAQAAELKGGVNCGYNIAVPQPLVVCSVVRAPWSVL